MQYLGDFNKRETIFHQYPTTDASGNAKNPSTSGTLLVFKNSTSVSTLTGTKQPATWLKGVHSFNIDTSGSFYTTGDDYTAVISGMVLDGRAINAPIARFSLGNRAFTGSGVVQGIATPIHNTIKSISGSLTTLRTNVFTISGNIFTLRNNVATTSGNITTLRTNIFTISGLLRSDYNTVVTISGNLRTGAIGNVGVSGFMAHALTQIVQSGNAAAWNSAITLDAGDVYTIASGVWSHNVEGYGTSTWAGQKLKNIYTVNLGSCEIVASGSERHMRFYTGSKPIGTPVFVTKLITMSSGNPVIASTAIAGRNRISA